MLYSYMFINYIIDYNHEQSSCFMFREFWIVQIVFATYYFLMLFLNYTKTQNNKTALNL